MSGLFDLEYHEKIREYQPPLIKLNNVINWELFRETIETSLYVEPKVAGGRQPYAIVIKCPYRHFKAKKLT